MPLYKYIADGFGTKYGLPRVIANLVNGGSHAASNTVITEFMVIPSTRCAEAAVSFLARLYRTLGEHLRSLDPRALNSGLEGGYTPSRLNDFEIIQLLTNVVSATQGTVSASLAIDIAASNLALTPGKHKDEYYLARGSTVLDYNEFLDTLASRFLNLTYIEDAFPEDASQGAWRWLRTKFNGLSASDDATSTDPQRIETFVSSGLVNAVVLKINQAGTVSELADAFMVAESASVPAVISHRSQETISDFVVHLAVGLGAEFLKIGAPARERIIKYNSLLRIAEALS